MANIGNIPPGGGSNGLTPDLRPAELRRPPAQQVSHRPAKAPASPAQTATNVGNHSLTHAAAYARGAAQVLPDDDPLKGFSKGLSKDLGQGRGFSAAGRIGALHNAHAYALAASAALQNSATLRPLR